MDKNKTNGRFLKVELSKRLDCDPKTLRKYLAMPDAPKPDRAGKYDLEEVALHIQKHAPRAAQSDDIKQLRAKKLSLECEKIALAIATERGEYVRMSEVSPVIAAFNAELTANMRAKLEYELPPKCVGKNEIEIRQMIKEAIITILTRLKEGQRALADASAS